MATRICSHSDQMSYRNRSTKNCHTCAFPYNLCQSMCPNLEFRDILHLRSKHVALPRTAFPLSCSTNTGRTCALQYSVCHSKNQIPRFRSSIAHPRSTLSGFYYIAYRQNCSTNTRHTCRHSVLPRHSTAETAHRCLQFHCIPSSLRRNNHSEAL